MAAAGAGAAGGAVKLAEVNARAGALAPRERTGGVGAGSDGRLPDTDPAGVCAEGTAGSAALAVRAGCRVARVAGVLAFGGVLRVVRDVVVRFGTDGRTTGRREADAAGISGNDVMDANVVRSG